MADTGIKWKYEFDLGWKQATKKTLKLLNVHH